MDEYRLIPCPFCGSNEINNTELSIMDDDGKICHYLCVCPDCSVMQIPCDTEQEAISAWNNRKTPKEIVNERLERSKNRLMGIREGLCGIYKENDPHIKLFDEVLEGFKEVLNGKH